MTVFAKGKQNIFIKKEKAKEFIEEWNKNVINDKLKKECKQASQLFRKK